jgi:nucleotide-binding universal stress UspA family protein
MVPLDGSELEEQALPHAEAIAKQRGADLIEVVLFRVTEPLDIISQAALQETPRTGQTANPLPWKDCVEQEMNRLRARNQDYLAAVASRLRKAGVRVRTESAEGKPADGILDYVNGRGVNLIVMTTHGSSGVSRWAYGSVAQKIIYGGSTPVLLVRPTATATP